MTALALIRHAQTSWNIEGRIQGHRDIALDDAGRRQLAGRSLPQALAAYRWVSSPLARARETAGLLGAIDLETEPRLIEMDWGQWEGRTLENLRAELGPPLAANEARGLDFRPIGGESPNEVQARLKPWLAEVARQGTATVAVTHKGIIRVVMAMAFDWNMLGKPPVRLDWACVHLFELAPGGVIKPTQMNLPLREAGNS